jgi:hypothetical protein
MIASLKTLHWEQPDSQTESRWIRAEDHVTDNDASHNWCRNDGKCRQSRKPVSQGKRPGNPERSEVVVAGIGTWNAMANSFKITAKRAVNDRCWDPD